MGVVEVAQLQLLKQLQMVVVVLLVLVVLVALVVQIVLVVPILLVVLVSLLIQLLKPQQLILPQLLKPQQLLSNVSTRPGRVMDSAMTKQTMKPASGMVETVAIEEVGDGKSTAAYASVWTPTTNPTTIAKTAGMIANRISGYVGFPNGSEETVRRHVMFADHANWLNQLLSG